MRKNDSVLEPQDPRQPTVRISDDDRQRMVEVLRSHCTDGRLTLDEFSDRVGLAFEAKTRADLELVVADLPAVSSQPVARVSEGSRRKPVGSAIAILSGHRQTGVWRPNETIGAFAMMGSVDLDLRHAEIEHPVIQINATAVMGSIEVIVPDGVDVELTGFNLMGSKESRVDESLRRPGAPLIRVNAFALMGSVLVRNKRSKSKPTSQGRRPDHASQAVARAEQRVEQELQRAHQRAERALQQAHRHSQRLGERFGLELPPLSAPPAPAAPAAEDTDDWRDELRSHAAPDGTVTILFSDMEGYTEMTERLGDLRAREILYAHNQIIREQVVSCGGFEVKSQGDGFMLAFAGASKALRCAVAIQGAFVDYDHNHPEEPIRVRMGLHTGEALKEADDFLGRTVIIASRIADEAKGGQILVSALLKELTDGTGEFEFGDLREVKLKGLTQTYRLYPVEWDAD
ncbi:MAG: eukaryotic-like serine/threonine-protein kinase [Actinomycetota bacterium]|jgi:class 3 adenylate cyclase